MELPLPFTQDHKIFIGCLPEDTSSSEIDRYLSQYVQVVRLKIRYRKQNSLCSGYGQATVRASEETIAELYARPHFYKGRSLEIRKFLAKKKFESVLLNLNSRRVYISGLPQGFSDEQLYHLFKAHGAIEKAYMASH